MAAGKHRAIDQLRRRTRLRQKHEELARELDGGRASGAADLDAAMDDDIGDDLLRLIFTACHPVLSTEARVALTLRLLGGLTTEEIARAFLTPEPTVAQRIVRAKRTLAKANVPYEVPRGAERQARLGSVLDVIYLVFNEGYSATGGDTLTVGNERIHAGAVPLPQPERAHHEGRALPDGDAPGAQGRPAANWRSSACFIQQGAHNASFDPIWNNLPTAKGVETHYPSVNVDVDKLLPANRASYRYDGSLTTPPCSEGVRWIVMSTPIELSAEQIKAFTAIIHDNNRPTQALNRRPVLTEAVSVR